jgi:hypothetical protein
MQGKRRQSWLGMVMSGEGCAWADLLAARPLGGPAHNAPAHPAQQACDPQAAPAASAPSQAFLVAPHAGCPDPDVFRRAARRLWTALKQLPDASLRARLRARLRVASSSAPRPRVLCSAPSPHGLLRRLPGAAPRVPEWPEAASSGSGARALLALSFAGAEPQARTAAFSRSVRPAPCGSRPVAGQDCSPEGAHSLAPRPAG